MPELPEVEAARKEALRHLRGRNIVEAHCRTDAIMSSGVSPRRIEKALRGATIEDAGRFGKHLWFELDRKPWPLFHFGMTGAFHFYETGAATPRFLRLELILDDGRSFAFTDARRFGRLRLVQDPRNEEPLVRLGHDPLFALPATADLALEIGSRKAPIKADLLDQTTFAGVGNWIADEVLYQAGIRPTRPATRSLPGGDGSAAVNHPPGDPSRRCRERRLRSVSRHMVFPSSLGTGKELGHRGRCCHRSRHRGRPDNRVGAVKTAINPSLT